jgi:hypothetical protein
MEDKIGLTIMRLLFNFASCCILCHYCSFYRSQLTHLKTFFPPSNQQSLLLIGRNVTAMRCHGCGWLCSNSGMAIIGEKRNKMRKETCVSTTAVMSPALNPRGLISALKRGKWNCFETWGGTVWRVDYMGCSVLARCDVLPIWAVAC